VQNVRDLKETDIKQEQLILVDENDRELGIEEKLKTHLEGKLHRAFSIFVFDDRGRLLLQKRASVKYHSAGLWSNTCCGHPRPGEETLSAARRRLFEEMNFSCELRKFFDFQYHAELENDLLEVDRDEGFAGRSARAPRSLQLLAAQGSGKKRMAASRRFYARLLVFG
jgi:isopentenyl-diphosphate Delta-isomerase